MSAIVPARQGELESPSVPFPFPEQEGRLREGKEFVQGHTAPASLGLVTHLATSHLASVPWGSYEATPYRWRHWPCPAFYHRLLRSLLPSMAQWENRI